MSFDVILPFLRPIAHLILDPAITEVMVNGSGRVFVEREGRLETVANVTVREQNLKVAVRNLARALGDDISEEQPLLDSRLPDGSRVAAALPPVSLGGTTLTIRKFQSRHFTVDELVRIGTLSAEDLQTVRQAIDARENILIIGGTGTGKTTLLTALATFLPANDRLVCSKTPRSSRSPPRILSASRPVGSSRSCRPSPLATCCARRCGIGAIAFWSARFAAARPSTCCKRSTLAFWNALDHPRQLGRTGVEPIHVMRTAVWRRSCRLRPSAIRLAGVCRCWCTWNDTWRGAS
jgi:hypothetical protein